MVWTPPTNVSSGADADSSKFNDETVANLVHLFDELDHDAYSVRAHRNAALNIAAASSTTLIAMDTESWDPGGNFDTATGRYTVPVTSYYRVGGNVSFNVNNNPDVLQIGIYVNATLRSAGQAATIRGGTAGDDWNLIVNDVVSVAAGDLIDIRVLHTTGGNTCALNVASANHNYITVTKVPTP